MRYIYLFGLSSVGWLGYDCISDIVSGAPPRNEFAPEGSKQEQGKGVKLLE